MSGEPNISNQTAAEYGGLSEVECGQWPIRFERSLFVLPQFRIVTLGLEFFIAEKFLNNCIYKERVYHKITFYDLIDVKSICFIIYY